MKIRNSALKIAIVIAVLHCLLGNIVGDKSGNSFVQIIFLPYSFIAALSNYAGWDFLSIVFEIGGLILMTLVFYPVGLLIKRKATTIIR